MIIARAPRVAGRDGRAARSWLRLAAGGLAFLLTSLAGASPPPAIAEYGPMELEVKGAVSERPSAPVGAVPHQRGRVLFGQAYGGEAEPNGSAATASPVASTNLVVRGDLFPNGDVDFYSFNANAGDRVYAAIMTSGSAGNSTDSQLTLIASDGTTTVEFDDDNGSFAALSSSIAGATIPTAGTYFLRVNDFTAGTTSERPYELHLRVQSGAPTPEVEGNDTPGTANVLPANGWVSGARNPAAATEQDWFSLNLNAGDTVFLSLDVDPERDAVAWNGRLGFGLFGDASNQILVVDDAGTGDVAPNPNLPSEALFLTVKTAGTYFAFVDSANAATGGPTATYHLSVSVHPATDEGVNCTTYTSTDVPQTIGPGTGLVSSTILVPGNPRIADVDVNIVLNHALMQDLDVHLRSPAGNDNGLFTDIGAAAVGGQAQMDTTFDDEAGGMPAFTALRGLQVKPENNSTAGTASTSGAYRLSWFDGENAGGTWTLDVRDDTAGANGGTLTSWSLRICEVPPPPACAAGFVPQTVYSTDFEADDGGFTHSGAQDEWERGLPATVATTTANPIAAFNTCHSGTNCWKTDLDNSYNASSSQDLLSPNINLAGLQPPVVVSWAQRHQVETANFDHLFIDAQEVGGANPVRLYEWLDPTPISASAGTGNPQANIGGSVGWGLMSRRADSLAGTNAELRFHLDSDTSVQFGGVAIDDVSVTACRAATADLSITKTDGVTDATPGGSVTYTITASNAGTDAVTGATVADTFPAPLTCAWTCVGAGGGTCTAAGAGNISDGVDLPAGGSVTYTASCTIAANASGTLDNTATISSAITDPNPANNSATDSDTLTPSADLSVTKTDGVVFATPGDSTTYTITASNAGPSDAPSSNVADTFPASLACTWTCVGAGGGTCTAAAAGNIADTVNLPAGGSVAYTASCTIAAGATGSLSNTATVASAITDPNPANNSATDADVLTPSADVSITKDDGVTAVTAGGSTTYTIAAANAGPSDAPAAVVGDVFPAECTGVTWTCTGAGGGGCTANGTGNINDTVNLPAGGSVTYSATCSIDALATGNLVNTANVMAMAGPPPKARGAKGAAVIDPNPGNNSATDTDTINPQPADVNGTKSVTGTFLPGTDVTYTVVLSNPGGAQADNPGDEFTDVLPAGLTLVSASATSGTAVANVGTGTVTWNGGIASGGNVTISIVASIGAGASGTISNQGNIAYDADANGTNEASAVTDDPGTAAVDDPTSFTVGAPQVDLTITKTDGVANVAPGGSTVYTIVAGNSGPNGATGATVTDLFPAACTTVNWTCAGAGGATCAANGSGNIGDTVNLPVGGTATYTATCTLSGSAAGTLVNTANVTAPAGSNETDAADNSATDTDTIDALQADLSTTLADAPDPVLAGANLTYTATIANNGPAAADAVNVSLPLPAGTTFVSAAPGAGGLCTTPAVGGTGTASCTWAGATPAAGTRTLTLIVQVGAGTAGPLAATATASSTTADPTPGNNAASASTAVSAGSADLSVTIGAAPPSVPEGGSVTLTATASNAGPDPAQNLVVTVALGPNLTFAAVNPGAGGVCTTPAVGATGNVVCTYAGATASGASRTVVVTATAASAGSNNVSGGATSDASDPTPANAQAITTVTISGGGVPSGGSAILIPALDRGMLLMLGLLFGLVGFAAVRRRS